MVSEGSSVGSPPVAAPPSIPDLETHKGPGSGTGLPAVRPPLVFRPPSDLVIFLRALRRRWLLACFLGVLAAGMAGSLIWLYLPERHRAEVRLQITQPVHLVTDEELARFQRTQAVQLRSAVLLSEVLKRPEVANLSILRQQPDPLTWLEQVLTVETGSGPESLRLTITADQADEVSTLARAIVETYLGHSAEAARQRQGALTQLEDSYRRAEESLRLKRARLAKAENPRLAVVEKDLQKTQFDRRMAEAELAIEEKRQEAVASAPAEEDTVNAFLKTDSIGRERLREVAEAEEAIATTLRVSRLKDRDPSLVKYYQQRDEAKRKLELRRQELARTIAKQGREKAVTDYEAQRKRLRERVALLQALEKTLQEELTHLGGQLETVDVKTLREEITPSAEAVQRLGAELQNARAVETPAVSWPGESVVVKAIDPRRRQELAGIGSGAAGLLLVLGVGWQEYRKRRITAANEIVCHLGLPVVGSIPSVPIPLRPMADIATPRALRWQGVVTEAVDALRTVLLRDGEKAPRVFLISSALGGEGKTSLASLLAASFARAWRKTLLIDSDLRKPEAHGLFGLPLEPGLSEVLRGEAEIADVVQPTTVSRLWMIPAGHWDTHAIQALAQEGAGELFEHLRGEYEFIVIDSCPVLPVADALLLSQYADEVLLAVRGSVSRLPLVAAAQQRLLTLDVTIGGAVLLGADHDVVGRPLAYPARAG
jgi:succinoglycan biosynthesis transport protein ExoP